MEVEDLARILQEQRGLLNHIHVSAAWVCLARMGRGGGGWEARMVLTDLKEETREVLHQMGARGIANVLHSMARLHDSRRKFTPKEGKEDRELLEAMQRRATATAGEFDPQNVANVLWALATMGEKVDRELLEAMQTRATATAGEFMPQNVANLMWALARMGERADSGLLEAMQRRATVTVVGFKPQAIANLLWALASMRCRADRGLLEVMQRRVTATAWEFDPQNVANVLWALARMGERVDRGLLEAMQTRATETATGFNPQAVTNVLWALATMGEKADPGLLKAMQRRAETTVGEFKAQNVANLLWALAVMGDDLGVNLAVLTGRLAARTLALRDHFTEAQKSQLHQWLLSCELGLAPGAFLPRGVARVKKEMGEECWQAFSRESTSSESRLQGEVVAALRSAGLEVEIEDEFHDARSGYSIDVLVRRRSAAGSTGGALWAVEVDGPFHFLGDARTPSGSTILKRRQLAQLGYTVVPVPFWEWDVLRGEEAKRRYLVDTLREQSETVP
ncbi:RAP domain-containing protein [Baffinella frigidus]|nr:RAP domain-containing protein [Cryptophyta sp. CCMP2293]